MNLIFPFGPPILQLNNCGQNHPPCCVMVYGEALAGDEFEDIEEDGDGYENKEGEKRKRYVLLVQHVSTNDSNLPVTFLFLEMLIVFWVCPYDVLQLSF